MTEIQKCSTCKNEIPAGKYYEIQEKGGKIYETYSNKKIKSKIIILSKFSISLYYNFYFKHFSTNQCQCKIIHYGKSRF